MSDSSSEDELTLDERLRRMEESALSKDDDLKREIEKLERDDGKA